MTVGPLPSIPRHPFVAYPLDCLDNQPKFPCSSFEFKLERAQSLAFPCLIRCLI